MKQVKEPTIACEPAPVIKVTQAYFQLVCPLCKEMTVNGIGGGEICGGGELKYSDMTTKSHRKVYLIRD